MVFGVIDDAGDKSYTYLRDIFPAIQNAQEHFNWLITDCYCNVSNPIEEKIARQGYCWILTGPFPSSTTTPCVTGSIGSRYTICFWPSFAGNMPKSC